MKKILSLVLLASLSLCLLTACGGQETTKKSQEKKENKQTEEKSEKSADLLSGKHHAEIVVKDVGTISLELDADVAPISVTQFVNLAKDGFYDGLTFHRIIEGFMMQGGENPDKEAPSIKGEFAENGVENNISHVRGVISMARAMDMDSATSQFFIVHQDSTYLDGQYAAFGKVTEGMEVVDQVCENTPVVDDNGTVEDGKQPVIEKITITD
ncbi:MAG: peptidylprolyl isomerase [Eubacterium sp.]|nr:peptidylprolyl isomerase [Eubacterium sp.]